MKTIRTNTLFKAFLSVFVGIIACTNNTQAQTARIAFQTPVTTKSKGPSSSYSQIFSMNSDGSAVAQLTIGTVSSFYACWSPSQQYIAFVRNNSLWIMDAVGEASGGRSFAVTPARNFGLDWSPDGTSLIYTGTSTALGLSMVSVNPATGAVGTPTLLRTGEVYWPVWSPDGTRIAFCSSYDGGTTQVVIVFDIATGAEISFGVGPLGSYNFQPAWKPDASQIAFTGPVTTVATLRNGKQSATTLNQVFIANANGTGIRQVTNQNRDCVRPAWSPDGGSLAFGSGGIYKMRLDTGFLTLLSATGGDADWNP
jgi:Tol biopolymer transport system component